ncbi:MAG TPA: hypothetical protein PK299_03535 [Anaerolineales bacterium]|nr:hypothetical protein [Anaerolineales bacterium]
MKVLPFLRVNANLYSLPHGGALVVGDWHTSLQPEQTAPVGLLLAFPMLTSPQLFFPQLVIDDYGSLKRDNAALDWIARRGNLHPRSEAEGVFADGTYAVHFLRDLDLGQAPRIFAAHTSHVTDLPVKALFVVKSDVTQPRPTQASVLPAVEGWLPQWEVGSTTASETLDSLLASLA